GSVGRGIIGPVYPGCRSNASRLGQSSAAQHASRPTRRDQEERTTISRPAGSGSSPPGVASRRTLRRARTLTSPAISVISRLNRRKRRMPAGGVAPVVAAGMLLARPLIAAAHAGGNAFVLLLPTHLYLAGGAIAVAASFVTIAATPPRLVARLEG